MVVIITSVAQRVDRSHGARGRNNLAVRIIFVARYGCAVAVYQPDHVALQVEDVVVISAVPDTASDRNQMRCGCCA